MAKRELPGFLYEKYEELRGPIRERLQEFRDVTKEQYFYEMCYCVCTPQSKAKNAYIVQKKLEEKDFHNRPFDPTPLLRDPANYIRFHNQKAKRLLEARDSYPDVIDILKSNSSAFDKRLEITKLVNGYGLKETSHFMRNIGYMDFAILDRHILKHMVTCGIYREIPKVGSPKQYFEVEKKFMRFAKSVGIPPEEIDMLFWSYESGEILK